MAIHKSSSYQILLICSNVLIASLALKVPENTQKDFVKSEPGELAAASSVASKSFKLQSLSPRSSATSGNRRYGYPYLIAPTLSPSISSRLDDQENEAIVPQAKAYGSKLAASEESVKKTSPKKYKAPVIYGATRRQGYADEDETLSEKRFRSYKEPTYRNFAELESSFLPRRIDLSAPYSAYDYSSSKASRRPPVSPRDPYLSPSHEPTDSFYPTVPKVKSYSTPYRGPEIPSYGAGKYEDSYYDDHKSGGYGKSTYNGPSSYPPTGGHYGYEDYAIESNKPIVGDIRKRLLDYAGASDLYEGEPDYLQEIARNKHKYGHVANDYYSYGRPEYKDSYREYPYGESKVSLRKKTRS